LAYGLAITIILSFFISLILQKQALNNIMTRKKVPEMIMKRSRRVNYLFSCDYFVWFAMQSAGLALLSDKLLCM
jgi:hypothetical protein